ncbi:minor tail protein [Mycobacterium phage ScoobyDoobyDoo]|nr:minor tail protein [Mycobacterium phage ScoobyDoobyDoo]
MADQQKYYFDFHFPLKVVQLILQLIFGKGGTDAQIVDPATREWFSQPRPGMDTGTEVITTTFKLPLSISELSTEILRVPCLVEFYYQDRNNNWRPVLDMTRLPVRINVARSDARSFYKFTSKVYPIVAKQLQIRVTRTNDPTMEGTPYVVGLRNTLIRRNVYDRAQGQQYFEEEQDVLGNVVSKYIKDWDASRAADDDPYTFWKSAPMPDPSAVANLFLDLRGDDGEPRSVDKFYIDPVYTGQHLNLYYSNDDTVGTRKLNPVSMRPDEDENTDWRLGRGRWDISSSVQNSYYRWTMNLGPQVAQNAWIGIEWTPDFDAADGPPQNPVLYRVTDADGKWQPTVEYDVGAGEFTLQFDDGTDTRTYSAPLTSVFKAGDLLRIMVGWRYAPDTVYISVVDRRGNEVARLEENPTTLPQQYSLDGTSEMWNFRGLVTALIVKLESYVDQRDAFMVSPTYYVDPDPVIPDPATGTIPSTSLDNAVYAVSWVAQEHGSGGASETAYEDKEWTPVWRNYVVEKGMLFLPQAISAKYWKFEFSQLTEQPYPIYESDIEVRYKVFPTSVVQSSSLGPRLYTGEGGFLGLGTFISINGVRNVNWLNPLSVLNAVGSVLTTQYDTVQINSGNGYISETMPNGYDLDLSKSQRIEAGSQYVYRREALQPYILAEDQYVTTIKAEGLQKLATYTDVPWVDIEQANPGAITHVRSLGALPIRGTDWWIYPGQQLKIPAYVMKKLTDTSTVTERKLTLERRVRFNTQSVHRYDYRTLKRDAAIAYFAGVREIIPFTSTFIAGEDKPYFDFPTYDPDQFVTQHIDRLDTGPITTKKRVYQIDNRLFERNLKNWIPDDATKWSWDGTTGRWLRGTAKLSTDGLPHQLLSQVNDVVVGESFTVHADVKWADLIVNDDEQAFGLAVRWYKGDDTFLSDSIVDVVSFSDWTENVDGNWTSLDGTVTAPASAGRFRVMLYATEEAQDGGSIWYENVKVETTDTTLATVYKSLQTMSTFSKVSVDFKDSGLWRGDSMWADINPDSQSIEDTELAYYTSTIPEDLPGGTWGDTIKTWKAEDAEWGSPYAVVNISVDPNRRYQGKRVLRFRRAAGAGEAGIKVKQWTNFVPNGLFRIGAVFYKPTASDNVATVRLRRLSDGVIVYEESVVAPAGRWHEFTTRFVEIPTGEDQEYTVELTLEGDAEDELYLSDLYTEIALVRYFVRLGGVGAYLHEVTDLRYEDGRVNVTTTTPVNDVSITASIINPKAWAYGCRVTPHYLK